MIVNIDATDIEALIRNDDAWLARPTMTIVINVECAGHLSPKHMASGELATYLQAARNALLAPFSENTLMILGYVRDLYEAEARRRVEQARQRERRVARYGVDSWEQADLLGEVAAVCGEGRRQGRQYWFRCPWHEDRTPSLHVDPERRIWHAFCCQRGGGVIAWRRAVREVAA